MLRARVGTGVCENEQISSTGSRRLQLNEQALSDRTTGLIHQIFQTLGVGIEPDMSPTQLRGCLKQKINTTNAEILAERVGDKAKLEELKARLWDVLDRLAQPRSEDLAARRNLQIEQLRLWVLARSINSGNAAFPTPPDLPKTEETVVQQQLRALELTVRDLVRDGYGGEQSLRRKLPELSGKLFNSFQSKADTGDILSGSNFYELSILFLDAREFTNRFDSLFVSSPLLRLLGKRRDTLSVFLNYAGQARNVLAHHKALHPEMAALLELCYLDIIEAVQEAHDRGETPVNPSSFNRSSQSELDAFLKRLEARERLDEKLAGIPDTLDALYSNTVSAKRRIGLVLVGVCTLGAMVATGLWLSNDTRHSVQRTGEVVNLTAESVGRVVTQTGETSRTADRIDRTTSQTAQQIQEAMQGDLPVEQPSDPDHYWHNFLLFERRNKLVEAEANLLGYVRAGGDKFDALLRAVEFLRGRYNRSEIRSLLLAQVRSGPSAAMRTALSRLMEPPEAEAELRDVEQSFPKLSMPMLEEARLHSTAVVAQMTNDELLAEHDALGRFLAMTRERPLGLTLQQPGTADAVITEATRRFGNLSDQTVELMRAGPRPTLFLSKNFPLSIQIAVTEPVRSLEYRVDNGTWVVVDISDFGIAYNSFRSSSMLQQPPPFGLPAVPGGQLPHIMAIPYGPVKLPPNSFSQISFRYTDLNGRTHGPFSGEFGLAKARLEGIEKDAKCERAQIYTRAPGSQPGVQCKVRFSDYNDIKLKLVRYSFTSSTPDREATPDPGTTADDVQLPRPAMFDRFVYQLLLTDGTWTSIRSLAP